MTQEQIREALNSVPDPSTGKGIVTAGRVGTINVQDSNVSVELLLPSLDVPYKMPLIQSVEAAIAEMDAGLAAHVHFTVDQRSDKPDTPLPQVKNIIAVASGKGGVGKSTVSVNLALSLQALGAQVGILDADIYGPSMPKMLGLEGQKPPVKQLHGQHKIVPLMAYDMPVMSVGFIVEPEQAIVLRGPRLASILRQFINDCLWPELDFLIIDLPPGTGDVQLTLVQTLPVTGAVLVTTPQDVAVADAIKAMNMFKLSNIDVPILGVVENMSWFTPKELPDNKYHIFGKGGGRKLALMSETMLLGNVPIVQGVVDGGDAGKPAMLTEPIIKKAFDEIARNTARQTAIRNELLAATTPVKVSR